VGKVEPAGKADSRSTHLRGLGFLAFPLSRPFLWLLPNIAFQSDRLARRFTAQCLVTALPFDYISQQDRERPASATAGGGDAAQAGRASTAPWPKIALIQPSAACGVGQHGGRSLHLERRRILYSRKQHHTTPSLFEIADCACQLLHCTAWTCQNAVYLLNVTGWQMSKRGNHIQDLLITNEISLIQGEQRLSNSGYYASEAPHSIVNVSLSSEVMGVQEAKLRRPEHQPPRRNHGLAITKGIQLTPDELVHVPGSTVEGPTSTQIAAEAADDLGNLGTGFKE
jgi:hypothetical protein